jgi:hypothetical protein
LLHEVELGVWRALFIHLLRILQSINPILLHELDKRYLESLSSFCGYLFVEFIRSSYRAVPTFGIDTIRRFSSNTSALKKLAGRDYEDLLQVCGSCCFKYYSINDDFVVRNTCLRWPISCGTESGNYAPAFYLLSLAWFSQVEDAYRGYLKSSG